VRLPCFLFLIERMHLSLSFHPQLSVIALFFAPQGLKNLAQGFNPGNYPINRFRPEGAREMQDEKD
jgi:hypothetical protein